MTKPSLSDEGCYITFIDPEKYVNFVGVVDGRFVSISDYSCFFVNGVGVVGPNIDRLFVEGSEFSISIMCKTDSFLFHEFIKFVRML